MFTLVAKIFRTLTITMFATFIGTGALAEPIRMEINQGWQFRQARLNNWYPATVPGVVHTDLLANGIIDDPFYRLNERGLQWIDKEDWIYQTTFTVGDEVLNQNNISLLFNGLDTYADVYLNDSLILKANNMFRQWRVDVKSILKNENQLKVYFRSPIKEDIPKWDALPFHYEATNDQSQNGGVFDKKVSVFARKAGYHYGWDWGPRFVTSGIWRPIVLEAYSAARIQNVQVVQNKVNAKEAQITHVVEVLSDKDVANATVSVTDCDYATTYASVKCNLTKGFNKVEVPFTIKNPKLWWSNGLGEAHLYHWKTTVLVDGKSIDSKVDNVGVRSLRMVHEPDQYGHSFYVELNGVPVFAKGANYIPCDNFLTRVTPEIYKKIILDAVNTNMNMLRVWGGGIYENDIFYDLCDQYGILVWQDFMFACSVYPAEGEWLENVRLEAIDNVRRLRNHPCIALWVGNNECNDAWFAWGWKQNYEKQNPEYAKIIWKQYTTQYDSVLPQVVKENSQSFYWPSSPFASADGASNNRDGDRHYWDVWHARKPIEMYNVERSRFFSEYGFQSFPEFESIKKYAPKPKDWQITSEVMMAHQRGGSHANMLIDNYLLNEYRQPRDFESFLYMNLILQGDAIKTAIEAHRRDRPYCMGTLFWQINDCWPVASWSSRDYYGRWKAQHYFAGKAYRNVLISPIQKDGDLKVYGVNDNLKPVSGQLNIDVYNLTGSLVNHLSEKVTLDANSSVVIQTVRVQDLLKGALPEQVVIHCSLNQNQTVVADNNYFLVKQKEMAYPRVSIQRQIKAIDGGFQVQLSTTQFVRGVFMSIDGVDNFFSDNYFDILPGQTVNVKVTTSLTQPEFEKQLKVVSLSDAYEF